MLSFGSMPIMVKVAALNVYPVKGMRAMPVLEREVDLRGLHGDRRWLVTDPTGRFCTQREFPMLAQFEPVTTESHLHLKHELHGEALVAFPHDETWKVVVWGSEVEAIDAGDLVADWLSSALGETVRLSYMPDTSIRPTDPTFSLPGDHVSFADGFPILIANLASLDSLNARLPVPIGIDRFRANIIVEGAEPFEETTWDKVVIGGQYYRVVKPCGRCIVTTTDQATGDRSSTEPLDTLTREHMIGRWAVFGMNVVPDDPSRVRVGDVIETSYRSEPWV